MIKKNDFHIHTEFSADSILKLKQLVKKAKLLNYSEIAITEHYDLTPYELFEWGLPPLKKYHEFVKKIQQQEEDNINIIFGLELGELHNCKSLATSILQYCKPQLTIGSIHVLPGNVNISVKLKNKVDASLITAYYKENLELVNCGGFDILGHLGVYKRYLNKTPDESHCIKIITEIFKTIIKKDIALEVNYSGLSKPLQNIVPDVNFLKLYKKMGGKLITLGSDSHTLNAFDLNREKAVQIVKNAGFFKTVSKKNNVWNFFDIE